MKRLAVVLAAVVLAACGSASAGPSEASKAADVKAHQRVAALVAQPASDKVLVIILENHALAQIQKDAPFTYSLGQTYGLGTNMLALTHPSKPNYAVISMGETRGITSDSGKTVKGATVFGNTIKAGRSAKIMAESMGSKRCNSSTASRYVPRHNPWTFNPDEKAVCLKYDFSYDTYGAADIAAGKLGNVELLIPNQCNNAHDCSLKTFDAWMKKTWARIISGPDWLNSRLTVVITADEDDKKHGNVIPLIIASPQLDHKVVRSKLTLYSLHRLLAQFGHTPPMAGGKTAPDMAQAFGLIVN